MLNLKLILFMFMVTIRKIISYQDFKSEAFCRSTINIAKNLNFFQIVLILDDVLHQSTIEARFTRKCIFAKYPTITVDFHSLKKLVPIMQYPVFGSPRSSALFVTLSSNHPKVEDTFSELNRVLDSYTKLWSRPIRPMWINIFFNENSEVPPNLEEFLRYSWKLKFLDMTILETRNCSQTFVHYYNPFIDLYTWKMYNKTLPTRTTLFPDKLRDMYGYPLRTTFIHEPPYLFIQQNSAGEIMKSNGADYRNIRLISKIMNFTLMILPTYPDDYLSNSKRKDFSQMSRDIFAGILDFGGNQLNRRSYSFEFLERSYLQRPESHCALVPIKKKSTMKMPHNAELLLFTGLYVLILLAACKAMRFSRELWTWVYLIKLIVGMPVNLHPRLLRERILMSCLIMLSLFYLSNFYSKITDMKLTLETVPFTSFKDLDESQLIPLVYPTFFDRTFSSFEKNHTAIQNLKNKTEFWNNPLKCANYMMTQNKSVFCILPETLGTLMIERFRTYQGKPRLRLMPQCFWRIWKSFAFTPGSPYIEKFDVILNSVMESGMPKKWNRRSLEAPVKDRFRKKHIKLISSQMTIQILLVLVIGMTVSTCIFFAEILVHRIQVRWIDLFKTV